MYIRIKEFTGLYHLIGNISKVPVSLRFCNVSRSFPVNTRLSYPSASIFITSIHFVQFYKVISSIYVFASSRSCTPENAEKSKRLLLPVTTSHCFQTQLNADSDGKESSVLCMLFALQSKWQL